MREGVGGRRELEKLLTGLPEIMRDLTAATLLPDASLAGVGGGWRVGDDGEVEPPLEGGVAPLFSFTVKESYARRGLVEIVEEGNHFNLRTLFATGGFSDAKVSGGLQWHLAIPPLLHPIVNCLRGMPKGTVFCVEDILASAGGPGGTEAPPPAVQLVGLLRVLVHCGFIEREALKK